MAMSYEEACAAVCAPGTMFEITDGEVNGVPTQVWAAAPPNIKAVFQLAAANADLEYIVYEDERMTVGEVLAQSAQIGDALVNRFGIEKGDRVAIAMRNYPEWLSSFAAIVQVGAVAVPMNAWWQTDEMVYALQDSGAKVVIIDEERLNRLQAASEDLTVTPVLVRPSGDLPEGVVALSDVLVEGAELPEVEIGPDDNMSILYTSGTTGFPKGATSTHRGVVSALLAFAARAAVGTLTDPPAEPAPEEPEVRPAFILCVPLFHVTGLVPVMLGSFLTGAKLVIMHRWDPNRALELIEREQVTNFVGVPTMSWDLLEAENFDKHDISSLQSVGGGGAPMPAELVQRIEDNFPNGRPGLGYGMTETNAYGPQNGGTAFVENPTSSGRCVPVMEVRVTDEAGTVLPTGETGEIRFKGPMLITEYWNKPEATAETIVDGWLRSGDLGRIDEEGFVYVSDRVKDMVLRGGENVYCAEVEAAIYEHPAVYETSVYGLPHERLGESVAAHVMVKPGETLDAAELQKFLGERVASFKVPDQITVVNEPLPRNAAGKILKRELRDQFA